MRLSDENTREGRHLTPEERIALQAEEIKQLWQENKQLRAQLDEWKYEVKCHMDEVVARDKEIEKLRAHVARMRDALQYYADVKRWGTVNLQYVPTPEVAKKALAEIDKAIGGKEDV